MTTKKAAAMPRYAADDTSLNILSRYSHVDFILSPTNYLISKREALVKQIEAIQPGFLDSQVTDLLTLYPPIG